MFSKHRRVSAALVMLAAAGLAACNNPVAPGERHIVPVGLVILQNGTQIVAGTSVSVTGAITATGLQTGPLTVRFLDIDGAEVDPGTEYHLAVVSDNSDIAVWEADQAGGFTGRVGIRGTGATTLRFRWMHGPVGSGHADLIVAVPVNVTMSQDPT